MAPSTFKSTAIVAVLLAAPTSAQIANWDINYQSLQANFTYGVTDEIALEYRIGNGRAYSVDLFDKGCVDPITGTSITTTNVLTPDVTLDHDQLDVLLDLDRSTLAASNIYDDLNAKIELCVRVQLLSGADIIKEDKRDIEVAFDLLLDFNVESISTTNPNLSPKKETDTASVASYVVACKCDDIDSFACNTSPLVPNDILKVCVTSIDAEVELAFVRTLDLFQGDAQANETLAVVQDLNVLDAGISSMIKKNVTAIIVETVVPSRFFQALGATLSVTGEVQVDFGARRLVAPRSTATSRAVRAESGLGSIVVARPGYPSGGPIAEHTADNFELIIGLATSVDAPILEVPHATTSIYNAAKDSNIGTIKAVGPLHFIGAIVCFVWAFFW